MDKIATRTLSYVDIFEEECWASLYDLLEEAILRSCERHGLDPRGVETWAIGYTHKDVHVTPDNPIAAQMDKRISMQKNKIEILTDGWDEYTWSEFMSDRCNVCWLPLPDEVVECSGCGMFCTECYERDSLGWHYDNSNPNHCGDMCPTCYEGDE